MPPHAKPPPVADGFLHWAAQTPDAFAIQESGRVWRYAELATAAAAVAVAIRAAGVGPGEVVAIDSRRGGTFVVGLLGTLLARCVAMPLDPNQPPTWCREALDEAGARLVLRGDGARLPASDRPGLAIAGLAAASGLAADIPGPDEPAYLFFTSGSTGRPKGVLGSHGGLGHFLAWQRDAFAVAPGDRVAHVTGLGFDVVLREIFVALTAGATLVIPDRDRLEDPGRFLAWLADEAITLLHAVPTVAAVWLAEAGSATRLPSLRVTFFAGEPFGRQLALRWRERLADGAEIVNLYGPTETTLAKCFYRLPQRLPFDQLPVGRPLPDCDILILDETGRPVVKGEAGEVAIRTSWRSLGYLSGPSPFRPGPDGGEPVYRSGDRGRLLADGNLMLLGRLDDQVKIRGVRVEPAGVAAVLAGHPAVRACAVLALAGEPHPRLVACVVGEAERADLRHYLAERLADAQVPTEFHFLADLPVTANGKLDRARLLERLAAPAARPGAVPASASERRIAAVFRELLGLPLERPITVEDDFFDLGGDSLQALAAISRINQGQGGRLEVADLFEAPDIRGLAERLDALAGTVPAQASAPLRPAPERRELPLSPAQERIWFQCQLEGERATAYNVPVAIAIRGRLDANLLAAAMTALTARHAVLRTTFPVRAGAVCQDVGPSEPLALPLIDLAYLAPGEQEAALHRHAQEQANQPFRTETERPLRILLLRLGEFHHVLLLAVHHLAFDGWSRWLLIRELGEHYTALARGASLAPVPAIQYGDYAVWCRGHAPRPESLDYWRRRLGDAPALDLPCDFPRSPRPSFHGARVDRRLPAGLQARIEALAATERATPYMVLLAGFKLLLARWTGTQDITVGSPVANRPRPELETLIGCFIEMLPIRTDLTGGPGGTELLRRVRAGVVDAFVHADAPFEKIVEHVAPPRRPGRHPLFDVMFNLVNVPQGQADPDGLAFAFADLAVPEAKFDLSLYARRLDGGLSLSLVYKTGLFRSERMERLLDAYVEVLHQLVDDPSRQVERFRIELDPGRPAPITAEPEAPVPGHVAPRDDDEARVAAVFAELLGCAEVAADDNFFALGGHSLLAMQAVSRLRRRYGAELPLHLMFTSRNVAELAAAIRRTLAEATPESDTGAPLTLSQARLLGFMADNPCSAHYNVPRKLRLRGAVDAERLERAINRVAARHTVLATGYRLADGTGEPVWREDERVLLWRIDVAAEPDPEAAADRLIAGEIARPFDLDAGPLLRAMLIRLGDAEHILLVSVHHVTADCWSMGMPFGSGDGSAGAWMAGVFFRQLWQAYHDPKAEVPAGPPFRFETVARRQNAWLASSEAARQLAYWRTLLADRPAALEVMPDLPRPAAWDFRGERLPLRIAPATAEALRAYARGQGTTLFVVLQSAFAVLLHGITGKCDLVTGTTAANRNRWEADELIGFFSNNLLLRTDLSGDPDFTTVVRRSHTAAFAAYAHQELPFEHILESLGMRAEADRHPLFQIRCLLHLPSDRPFADGVLTMTPEATGREVAKYDLTLLLADGGNSLEGWLEYATSLYRRASAEAILAGYLRMLDRAMAHPEWPLSALAEKSA
jgi:amino acid adenylation domain-containing protein